MKKHLLFSLLLICTKIALCQNIKKDIERDWYFEAPTPDYIAKDTLILIDRSRLLKFENKYYRSWYANNHRRIHVDIDYSKGGIFDGYPIKEKWKVKSIRGKLFLIILSEKRHHWYANKIMFQMDPIYKNGELDRVVLVRRKGIYQ